MKVKAAVLQRIGAPAPYAESRPLRVAKERTIKGSYIGSCVPARDIPRFVALYRQGRLPVDRLMSERVGFEGLNAAFDRLAGGHTVRQLLLPGASSSTRSTNAPASPV